MNPDDFFRYVDREFNLHRENGIRDLNEGNANPGDRYTAALQITEEMVHHVFGNTDHFDLWCREHGFQMTAHEGYGHYRIQRGYRAERIATPRLLGPVLGWHQEPEHELAIAETTEWTLTERPYRLDRDIVYGAQGGYIVPPDIAAHILDQHEEPEEIVDAITILMEDEDIKWLAINNPSILQIPGRYAHE